jgi:iron complex outermembrane receptor protein
MVDYTTFGAIQARNRPFAARNYIPEEGLDRTNLNSFPANVETPVGVRNPTGDPARGYANPSCAPPLSFPTAGSANEYQCRWNGDGSATISNPSERLNIVVHSPGSSTATAVFLTGTCRNQLEFVARPTQVSSQTTFQQLRSFLLPAFSCLSHDFARVRHRRYAQTLLERGRPGARTLAVTTGSGTSSRGCGAGRWAGRTTAFNYSRSDAAQRSAGGYLRESVLMDILNRGVVNPFGPNAQPVVDLMSTATFEGTLRTGRATLSSLDFIASNEILALPAGPLSLALGLDARREELTQTSDPTFASGDILDLASTQGLSGKRNVRALFVEANAPLAKGVEAGIAVRYDHYSDFAAANRRSRSDGSRPRTVARFGGHGFLAPADGTLYRRHGLTSGNLSDPVRCPATHAAQDCNTEFPTLGGGNPALQPVTSSQWSVGGVWAPTRELTLGVDYVSILLANRISFFSAQQILALCPNGVTGLTCYLIHRGPTDPAYPTLPGPIIQIDQFLTNFGKQKASAIDFSVQYHSPEMNWGRFKLIFNGTYNIENQRQQLDGSYVNQVNHYTTSGGNPGVIPYWHHYVELDWNYGPWSVTLTENFQTGAYDQSPGPGTGNSLRVIGDYDVWNASFAYAGLWNWTLSAGIKNLFDRNPPFSNQTLNFQVGYDPSYGDPHGRLFWVGARYAFK